MKWHRPQSRKSKKWPGSHATLLSTSKFQTALKLVDGWDLSGNITVAGHGLRGPLHGSRTKSHFLLGAVTRRKLQLLDAIKRLFVHQVRVGYVRLLLLIDLVLIVLPIGADLFNFHGAALGWRASVSLARLSGELVLSMVCLLFLLTIVIPCVVAILRIWNYRGRLEGAIMRRGPLLALLHIFLSCAICAFIPIATAMERLSGRTMDYNTQEFAFSYFSICAHVAQHALIIGPVSLIVGWVAGVFLVPWLRDYAAGKPGTFTPLRRYAARLALADLDGRLYPLGQKRWLNFNAAAAAPETAFVRVAADKLVREYHSRAAGSPEAKDWLSKLFSDTETKLARHLLPSRPPDVTIELFPGTSRALEVAIVRAFLRKGDDGYVTRPGLIILSPYEHPAERAVAKWLCSVYGLAVCNVNFDQSDFVLPLAEQCQKFVQMAAAFVPKSDSDVVLVISEVHYATGMLVPIAKIREELTAALEDCARDGKLKFVVDGAHTFGTTTALAQVDEWDSYVLSGHKWLLSPEPCGVLLTSRTGGGGVTPYDCWRGSLPPSTTSVRMAAALHASLQMIDEVGIKTLRDRSSTIVARFLESIEPELEVVRALDAEYVPMRAVRPAPNHKWKFQTREALDAHLKEHRTSALVLHGVEEGELWVRLSFPYFLNVSHIDRVCRVLRAALEPSP